MTIPSAGAPDPTAPLDTHADVVEKNVGLVHWTKVAVDDDEAQGTVKFIEMAGRTTLKPDDIPDEQPTKFDLLLNMKTAKGDRPS